MKTLEHIIEKFPEELRLPLYEAFTVVIEQSREILAKEEISKVWEALRELTSAQKRTEQRVEELTQAQKRTEQRVEELAQAHKRSEERLSKVEDRLGRVEKAVEELAKAQKRTEQRVEELAQAQKRTEQRVEELAQAQKRTEQRVEELASAQKKTEQRVEKLAGEMEKLAISLRGTRVELGGLSRTMSYAFENEAFRVLPGILSKKYGIEIKEKLVRVEIGGKEINIFGKAMRNGKKVLIVGEAKLRLSEKREQREVFKELDKRVEAVFKEYGKMEVVKIIITHFAKKGFLEKASAKGIIVIQSFEW